MDITTLRHSCAHVMAQAVKELWPETKLGIGPAIEEGFYYDFDRAQPFTEEELKIIEERMLRIIAQNLPFSRMELSKAEAMNLFKSLNETYKLELLQQIPDDKVIIYKTGEKFLDLCRGPHITNTSEIKAFRLLSIAGAYWHGIETNPVLQRIYGTCFFTSEELEGYLKNLEEAKARDHRKLGPQLGFFDIYQEEAGAGLVFYHPKGAVVRKIIEEYETKEHLKRGYQLVITPHIMQAELWKTSGHYEYYKENMYTFNIDEKEFVLKPMNCPGHILIYKSHTRSYRDLPLRLFELGTVYRYEKAGVLHGLLRVRGFTQDDAHIFCLPEQLKSEISGIMDFVFETMRVFGFEDLGIELSTRPAKFIGSEEDWQRATQSLEEALRDRGLSYEVNAGEGAFYGPKIDIKLKDALKRKWQCATIQCDFALPKRFNLEYIDAQGKKEQPIVLHRVLLGSLERFMGALLEHYKGAFPLWLAPIQVIILPVSKNQEAYARLCQKALQEQLIRVELDNTNETLDKRIRNAEIEKIPYIVVVGKREENQSVLAVRRQGQKEIKQLSQDDFILQLKKEIEDKRVK